MTSNVGYTHLLVKIYSAAFATDLEEGRVYSLCNFKVLKYKDDGKNRCVRNDLHIYFDSQTEIKHLTEEATKEIYLTNYPPTRYYIDPDHYSVDKLKESVIAAGSTVEVDTTIYTVKELRISLKISLRFKICTICDDDTCFMAIIFQDDELQRITGKDVCKVENELREALQQGSPLIELGAAKTKS
ncbi:uncharacterized protein LOC141682899 isoform X2 [Apium graveolens]|uniref:uncharacterized protein LOC141682899 isoform X2 n=1 Tax=Apium graveolens TaxID=4045 RepID=UPI003D7A6C17